MKTFCLIFIVALAGCSSGPPCSEQIEDYNFLKKGGANYAELGASAFRCACCFERQKNAKEWRKWKDLSRELDYKWFHQ